jgi:hypothetical protein
MFLAFALTFFLFKINSNLTIVVTNFINHNYKFLSDMGFFTTSVKKNAKEERDFQNLTLLCPRCNIPMKKIMKNGVTIDFCTKCKGMWLDAKEVDKLVSF